MRIPDEYAAAQAAELARIFGRNACNVRYTAAGRGEPGTDLRRLYETFTAASRDLTEAFRRQRNEA